MSGRLSWDLWEAAVWLCEGRGGVREWVVGLLMRERGWRLSVLGGEVTMGCVTYILSFDPDGGVLFGVSLSSVQNGWPSLGRRHGVSFACVEVCEVLQLLPCRVTSDKIRSSPEVNGFGLELAAITTCCDGGL